ncbi:hypothetical protein [Brevundimonas sp. Root1279]|uniref:hypothetical protein n=1 Tax=Brevundimonas sp. Root1279 TaxID=1736443 RepID=UPI0006F269DF|nr:hypothetical protein [Brevundimonas sp. Root1279]KQW86398.1 hypothetical protein ASC65_00365 [Brevundimonas sp. Root1279]
MTARKTLAIAALAAVLGLAGAAEVAVAASPAAVQSRDGQNRRVRVHNQTGAALQQLRAADVRTGEFGGNLLGGATVAAGSSAQVLIDDGQGGCLYDLRAELAGGTVVLRENVNVCRIADFYLTR